MLVTVEQVRTAELAHLARVRHSPRYREKTGINYARFPARKVTLGVSDRLSWHTVRRERSTMPALLRGGASR